VEESGDEGGWRRVGMRGGVRGGWRRGGVRGGCEGGVEEGGGVRRGRGG
jgi:hypothetical protein